MEFNFANAFEKVADTVPDHPALIFGDLVRSWREYDDRASRLAAVLVAHGLGPHSKVGLYLHNSNEYSEAHLAAFKLRGIPVNINYRYQAKEVAYLLENADAEAVVFHAQYGPLVAEAARNLPSLKCLVCVDDGSGTALQEKALDYESALASHDPMPRIDRPFDDIYMIYTGGTTGMPKGVMYHNGAFCEAMFMGYGFRGLTPPQSMEQIPEAVEAVYASGDVPVSLVASPQMHGTGIGAGTMMPHLLGGSVITLPGTGLDSKLVWQTVELYQVTDITIVGDVFAKPLLAELDAARDSGRPYDLSSLRQIISSGVMWSAEVKHGLLKHHDMLLVDAMASSEGPMAVSMVTRETQAQTARFSLNEGAKVFRDDGTEVEPGSGEIGLVATTGLVPLGYYKDPAKSAQTFREIGGIRYAFPGDFASVDADGTITLLGRGSQCINTGGEKVFPEEVEEAIKRVHGILDCLVVGLPDERFGERIVAVVSCEQDGTPDDSTLQSTLRMDLAGYKIPKEFVRTRTVVRSPSGKADYGWARDVARSALVGSTSPANG